MPHVLNLTLPIRQDAETLAKVTELEKNFADMVQPKIDAALRESRIVHSARVVVIDNQYLQVLTVYDGDHREYTEFFRQKLPDVFALLFSLSTSPPAKQDLEDPDSFFKFAASCQKRSLGNSTEGLTGFAGQTEGYLFSAFGSRTVKEIQDKLAE